MRSVLKQSFLRGRSPFKRGLLAHVVRRIKLTHPLICPNNLHPQQSSLGEGQDDVRTQCGRLPYQLWQIVETERGQLSRGTSGPFLDPEKRDDGDVSLPLELPFPFSLSRTVFHRSP